MKASEVFNHVFTIWVCLFVAFLAWKSDQAFKRLKALEAHVCACEEPAPVPEPVLDAPWSQKRKLGVVD